VARLLRWLGQLAYPPERLEILLICEPDDDETIAAIRAATPGNPFRLVICPRGQPQTKPRACNVGLREASGSLCVIFDAEDRPDLDQLRRSAEVFAVSSDQTICLQARLGFYNCNVNWLARCSTVEYGVLFGLLLPGLVGRGQPVPLGGTSNHFRTDALRLLGGWDPYNVAEDADVGMRLHAAGGRTQMLSSDTQEEACAELSSWLRQRTRWMKGYLQTWAVHARGRRPTVPMLAPALPSMRSALTMHWLVGGAPIGAVLFLGLVLVLVPWSLAPTVASSPPAAVARTVLVLTCAIIQATGLVWVIRERRWRLLPAALTLPVYFGLISLATVRAVTQLMLRPHLWEKTPHGLPGSDSDPSRRERRAAAADT
jgi:glycosyltransferase XagB